MKPLDRFNLIDQIGRKLQAQMTTTDINVYLGGFKVSTQDISMAHSKWVYVKDLLKEVDDDVIHAIANDLDIRVPSRTIQSSSRLLQVINENSLHRCEEDFEQAINLIETDPATSIGMASSTLESICKAILDGLKVSYPKDQSLSSLLKTVMKQMNLSPNTHADEDIKRTLGGLFNAGAGISNLRTKYSAFHGKGQNQLRLGKRHARLAVNASTTVGLYLLETYMDRYAQESEN